jgi:signal transduction histidine kinase
MTSGMTSGTTWRTTWRRRAGTVAASAVLLAGVGAGPGFGPSVTLPPAAALAALLGVLAAWPHRRWVPAATAAAGAVSLGTTLAVLALGDGHEEQGLAAGLVLVEAAALLTLITLTVRVAPVRAAVSAASVAGAGSALWILRFGPPELSPAALAGFGFWALAAVLAAGGGMYLRSLDDHRARSVLAARRAQRLQLARDLHDFVAHDVSEMLAQAQAGQIVAAQDPPRAVAAFGRIEQAALAALAAMDRTVRMLHEPGDPDEPGEPAAGPVGDTGRTPLPTLADRFAASGAAAVKLDLDPRLAAAEPGVAVPREVATTVYRVVVEALTNVRRHAPDADLVRVVVRHTERGDGTAGIQGPAVEVAVTDDAGAVPVPGARSPHSPARRSGLGLPGLTERVAALGGTLTAGPVDPCGWRVTAVLPLAAAPFPAAARAVR